LAFTIAYCLLPTACLYGSGAGTTAGVTMLSTVGSRNSAMGGAFTSISGDCYSLYSNPAGLAEISKRQLTSFFVKGQSDDYKASVIYAQRLLSDLKSGYGFGVYNLNGGKMDINYVDGTSESVVSQSDFLAVLGWGGYTARNFMLGYSLKYLSTELVGKYKASAFALDAGFIAKLSSNLSWGAAVQNYGTKLKYNEVKESLPFLAKSGISLNMPFGMLVTADGVYLVEEQDTLFSGGVEYSIMRTVFLRGGYKKSGEVDSITGGVGLRFADTVAFDWATEMSDLSTDNNVSLTLKF